MKVKQRLVVVVALIVCLGVLAGAQSGLPALPFKADPLKSAHRDAIESVFDTPFSLGFDQSNSMAFYMGTDLATVPNDTYASIRYVLFRHENLSNPTVSFQSRGGADGSANPSHVVIFGWQDYKNYYYVYAAESPETRVARVVDGKHETLYRHGSVIWTRSREVYQDLKVEVKPINGSTVVNTYVNGDLAMSYTFSADVAPPVGRAGFGGWNGAHSAYFKNITLAAE